MKHLDSIDYRIMRTLLRSGNMPNTKLSSEVGLSTSQCWQRVQRLQRDGYISGYQAIIDHEKLGYSDTVLVDIATERNDVERISEVCDQIAKFPEVLEIHLTSGEYDIFIKVAVSGTRGFEDFLSNRLRTVRGIRHSRSSFSLKCMKNEKGFVPE